MSLTLGGVKMSSNARWKVFCILLAGTSFCDQAISGQKLQEPRIESLEREQKAVKQAFGIPDKDKAAPDVWQGLAVKLREAAQMELKPDTKYALFREAESAALEASDYGLMMSLVDSRAAVFACDRIAERVDRLGEATNAKRLNAIKKDINRLQLLFIQAKATAELCLAADDVKQADRAVKAAHKCASLLPPPLKSPAKEANRIANLIENREKLHEKIKKATEILAKSPLDGDANLTLGRYNAFVRNDPDGLTNLANGADLQIASLARHEIRIRAVNPPVQQDVWKLASDWWEVAEQKTKKNAELAGEVKRHAVSLYAQLDLTKLAQVERQLAETRIKEMQQSGGQVFDKGFYTSYRLVATKSAGTLFEAYYREIEFIDALTDKKVLPGEYSASNPPNDAVRAAAAAAMAFDGNLDTAYQTAFNPEKERDWIQYTAPFPVKLSGIKIKQNGNVANNHIHEFELQGFVNGGQPEVIKKIKAPSGEVEVPLP